MWWKELPACIKVLHCLSECSWLKYSFQHESPPVTDARSSACADQPGNEAGYVVKMTDDNVSPPYKIAPGTRVRLESAYDGNTRRLGVMVRTLARYLS